MSQFPPTPRDENRNATANLALLQLPVESPTLVGFQKHFSSKSPRPQHQCKTPNSFSQTTTSTATPALTTPHQMHLLETRATTKHDTPTTTGIVVQTTTPLLQPTVLLEHSTTPQQKVDMTGKQSSTPTTTPQNVQLACELQCSNENLREIYEDITTFLAAPSSSTAMMSRQRKEERTKHKEKRINETIKRLETKVYELEKECARLKKQNQVLQEQVFSKESKKQY